jgi:hypothetical protein
LSDQTKVHVNHPTRPVLLVLTSYKDTEWRVLPAPGTRIKAVVLSTNDGHSTVLAPPQVPVVNDELPHATETGNIKFRELIGKLHARYGVNKVTAFRGGYTLPDTVPVTGPYAPDPNLSLDGVLPEVPRVRMSFDLVSVDGRRLPWTNTGPKDGKRFEGVVLGGGLRSLQKFGACAVGDDGSEAYCLQGNGGTLMWFPKGVGAPGQKVDLPKNLPELSWGAGLAWDSRKGVLAIVSFGGEGHFYRYDTRSRQWLGARSLQNRDLLSVALDALTGGYVGISEKAELVIFNQNGELEEVRPIRNALTDLDSTYDKNNSRLEGLTLAVRDGTDQHRGPTRGGARMRWRIGWMVRDALRLAASLCAVGAPAWAALPPQYLSVPHFQQCLATQTSAQYQSWCMPLRKSRACPQASWQQLQALKHEGQLLACRTRPRQQ